jgi:cyclic pyranopterin phosphate synthase
VGKTGVEMEALAGVSAAALCLYDLTKGIDPVLKISDIQLELKEGGKTGLFLQPGSSRAQALQSPQPEGAQSGASCSSSALSGMRAAVLVLSDRCSRGEVSDRSGQPRAIGFSRTQLR